MPVQAQQQRHYNKAHVHHSGIYIVDFEQVGRYPGLVYCEF